MVEKISPFSPFSPYHLPHEHELELLTHIACGIIFYYTNARIGTLQLTHKGSRGFMKFQKRTTKKGVVREMSPLCREYKFMMNR